MNIENAKAQMRKGILGFCILSIIENGEVYSLDIIDILRRSKLLVVEGTIYPLLTRLKNTGLLNYRWEESSSGPPRKYFSLTAKGKVSLNSLSETWKELSESVDKLTKNIHHE